MLTDVTEQRKVAATLRESTSLLGRLREANVLGVVSSTEHDGAYEANDAFLDRRVGLHPQDREEYRRDAVAVERHTRVQVRDGGARRVGGEPDQAVLLGDPGAQPCPPRRPATGSRPTSPDSATGCQNCASAGCALVNSSAVMSDIVPLSAP
jgi:hypothetical protein